MHTYKHTNEFFLQLGIILDIISSFEWNMYFPHHYSSKTWFLMVAVKHLGCIQLFVIHKMLR